MARGEDSSSLDESSAPCPSFQLGTGRSLASGTPPVEQAAKLQELRQLLACVPFIRLEL
eukprot:CAMPEP_0183368362 /NCGR_PEP_ID=MMETSP0164_2-20130417/95630_1 /TAXON_ID=221442 /ORGANISM="Coccolithus pelagicus ssp braarudi, Strain PLY182g" /LENGTH=58 /DNA_ID=CAMNT_0025544439 /DNA_START=35 /DNA_END=208 /DNA_ORIENTATION=+